MKWYAWPTHLRSIQRFRRLDATNCDTSWLDRCRTMQCPWFGHRIIRVANLWTGWKLVLWQGNNWPKLKRLSSLGGLDYIDARITHWIVGQQSHLLNTRWVYHTCLVLISILVLLTTQCLQIVVVESVRFVSQRLCCYHCGQIYGNDCNRIDTR